MRWRREREGTAVGGTAVPASGIPHRPSGGGSIAPPIFPCPSLKMSIKDLRSIVSASALRKLGLSKGGASRLISRLVVPLLVAVTQIALGFCWAISRTSGGVT
jgi:hypothetical protein